MGRRRRDVLIGAEAQSSIRGEMNIVLRQRGKRGGRGGVSMGVLLWFFSSNRRIPLSHAWGETNTGSSDEGEFPRIYLSCVEKQQSPN